MVSSLLLRLSSDSRMVFCFCSVISLSPPFSSLATYCITFWYPFLHCRLLTQLSLIFIDTWYWWLPFSDTFSSESSFSLQIASSFYFIFHFSSWGSFSGITSSSRPKFSSVGLLRPRHRDFSLPWIAFASDSCQPSAFCHSSSLLATLLLHFISSSLHSALPSLPTSSLFFSKYATAADISEPQISSLLSLSQPFLSLPDIVFSLLAFISSFIQFHFIAWDVFHYSLHICWQIFH